MPTLTPIGVVRSARTVTEQTPVQAALNRDERGRIELRPEFADGLLGLDEFDYLWVLTWLHRPHAPGPAPLRQVPFLLRPQRRSVGLFAMRGPRRVNPIGLSLVRLIGIDGLRVDFAGVDLIDETPVVDIKPYVTRFDRPAGEPRCGWFDTAAMPESATPAQLGAAPDQPT